MKVKKLIEKLSALNQNAEVFLRNGVLANYVWVSKRGNVILASEHEVFKSPELPAGLDTPLIGYATARQCAMHFNRSKNDTLEDMEQVEGMLEDREKED